MKLVEFDKKFIEESIEWHKNPIIADSIGLWKDEYTDKELKAMAESWLTNPGVKVFGIMKADKPVGYVMLKNIDLENKSAEIHVTIGDHTEWGNGLAYYAYKGMIEYGFNELNLNRISTIALEGKGVGSKIMIKKPFGFEKEGILKECIKAREKYIDVTMYALLKKNYKTGIN